MHATIFQKTIVLIQVIFYTEEFLSTGVVAGPGRLVGNRYYNYFVQRIFELIVKVPAIQLLANLLKFQISET